MYRSWYLSLVFCLMLHGFSLAAELEDTRPVVRFGLPPWQKSQSQDEIGTQYQMVLDWLGTHIGYRIVVVGGRSYEDMIDLVAQGNVQIAALSPVPYVQAKRKNPELELLLTELKWNETKTERQDSYRGFIVARQDRTDIATVADLRGKRIAFVNLESTSGWRYPHSQLLAQGLDVRTQATVLFLGSHPRVTDAVVAGSVDAGATWDFNLQEAQLKHGQVLKTILSTPPIPNICLVASSGVSVELRAKIREALLAAPADIFVKAPMCGYAVRPDSFYDVVRTLVDSEKLPNGPAQETEPKPIDPPVSVPTTTVPPGPAH